MRNDALHVETLAGRPRDPGASDKPLALGHLKVGAKRRVTATFQGDRHRGPDREKIDHQLEVQPHANTFHLCEAGRDQEALVGPPKVGP